MRKTKRFYKTKNNKLRKPFRNNKSKKPFRNNKSKKPFRNNKYKTFKGGAPNNDEQLALALTAQAERVAAEAAEIAHALRDLTVRQAAARAAAGHELRFYPAREPSSSENSEDESDDESSSSSGAVAIRPNQEAREVAAHDNKLKKLKDIVKNLFKKNKDDSRIEQLIRQINRI